MLTNVYKIMEYSSLDVKRFRNARHKCAPKPWTGLKSWGKKITLLKINLCCSWILFTLQNKKKMFTNLGITLILSQKYFKKNVRHKCALKPCTDLKSRNMIALSNIVCVYDEGRSKIWKIWTSLAWPWSENYVCPSSIGMLWSFV